MTPTIGLVVNPVAGIGGPAGLKGSDGPQTQALALARGAAPRAGERARSALTVLARAHPGTTVLTAAGRMGEEAVRAAGLPARVVHPHVPEVTAPADTVSAARALSASGVTLILFAGGDGTARDVCDAVGAGTPVLGIPAGVKMYSACFAVSPAAAGSLAVDALGVPPLTFAIREVLDIDEDRVRAGLVDPRLHGQVLVPSVAGRTQARKAATPASEAAGVRRAAAGAVEAMQPGVRYLLGPGSTLGEVARLLGVAKTPLGVDVVQDGQLVLADGDEQSLLAAIEGQSARAVVTVIGGQGFLFGRGNQQLSARVLRAVESEPIVLATEDKLAGLGGLALLVDTGDPRLDRDLAGYQRVVTGPGTHSLYPVRQAEQQGTQPWH